MKLPALLISFEYQLIAIYSAAVVASATPSFRDVSGLLVVPYYLFVPGYVFSRLIVQRQGSTALFLLSLVLSVVMLSAVYSIQNIVAGGSVVPDAISIPAITLLLLSINYTRKRER